MSRGRNVARDRDTSLVEADDARDVLRCDAPGAKVGCEDLKGDASRCAMGGTE